MTRVKFLTIISLILFVGPGRVFSAEEHTFENAIPGRVFTFPRDHGKHPAFKTEWWYFTGNVTAEDGSKWGFQLTFFRRSFFKEQRHKTSTWGVRDVYAAHFAVTDGTGRRFFHKELISREGPGLAGASDEDLNVHLRDWNCRRQGDTLLIKARQGSCTLNLRLSIVKPPILHGDSGYSRKGESQKQASYYYSFSRLNADGTLDFDGRSHTVRGSAWMDHEFGSAILHDDQAGWDWFSLQLDDGTDLMLFRLRKKDGTYERIRGTLVSKDGIAVDLSNRRIIVTRRGVWTSPHTGAEYPSLWTIEAPDYGIKLDLAPLLNDQELVASSGIRVAYWEGAVIVKGMHRNKPVLGKGYVELTGYAHSLGGRL